MQRRWLMIGALLMMLGVGLGAFGAHALKPLIGVDALSTYETGVKYHQIHAVGLLVVAVIMGQWGESGLLKWSARLLFTGIVLFSGSLYLLSITGARVFGPITPFGGVCFVTGWFLLFWAALKKQQG